MRLGVDFNILNQKGTPAFYSDIFANRPSAGFAGRVFISTDTGAIYEDTGSAWTLIADATGIVTTPNLQSVTDVGNTTTNSITANGVTATSSTGAGIFNASGLSGGDYQINGVSILNTTANNVPKRLLSGGFINSSITDNGTSVSVANTGGIISLNASGVGVFNATGAGGGDYRISGISIFNSSANNVPKRLLSGGYTNSTITDSGTQVTISALNGLVSNAFIKLGALATDILAGNGTIITAGTGITISGGTISASGGGGGVTSVTATLPINSSGGTTPNISINQASTFVDGFLTSMDWNTFNNKLSATGTSTDLIAGDGSIITAGTNITISGGTISASGGGGGGITGSGNPNRILKFTGTFPSTTVSNSNSADYSNRVALNIFAPPQSFVDITNSSLCVTAGIYYTQHAYTSINNLSLTSYIVNLWEVMPNINWSGVCIDLNMKVLQRDLSGTPVANYGCAYWNILRDNHPIFPIWYYTTPYSFQYVGSSAYTSFVFGGTVSQPTLTFFPLAGQDISVILEVITQ